MQERADPYGARVGVHEVIVISDFWFLTYEYQNGTEVILISDIWHSTTNIRKVPIWIEVGLIFYFWYSTIIFLARFKSKSVLEIFGTLGHFGAFWGFGTQKNVKNCRVQNSFHETGIIFHIGSFWHFFRPKSEYHDRHCQRLFWYSRKSKRQQMRT